MPLFKRKPLSELTPAYRRRIERAEALGFTRSQARGHAIKTEYSITEFMTISRKPDNTKYLLKRVIELKDPALIKQFNQVEKLSREVQNLPKGSAARERKMRERDALAKNLAGKVRDTTPGTDLYALPSGKSPYSKDLVEESGLEPDMYDEF
jgi:hypothetical protein